MGLISIFYEKFCFYRCLNLFVVEERRNFCLKIFSTKSHECVETENCEFFCSDWKRNYSCSFFCKTNCGEILMQIQKKARYFFRNESDMWTEIEAKYNDKILTCRAMLKCLKKFHYYFYELHFILNIDSKILIAQLNCSDTNFSAFFIIRWIAWVVRRLQRGEACGLLLHYLGLFTKKNKHKKKVWWCLKTFFYFFVVLI